MANNRMALVCSICVEQDDAKEKANPSVFWLAKRMRDGYYAPDDHAAALNEWFDQHSHATESQDHFSLHYQIQPPNYDIGTGFAGLLDGQLRARR
jgi:hypothetical protein